MPKSYRLHDTAIYYAWFREVEIYNRVSYDWLTRIVTFEDEDDAIAFQLRFGITQSITDEDNI